MVFLAAGSTTENSVCIGVAPSASAPSRYSCGTALIASIVMVMTVGKIIMERMMMAASIESPLPPMEERINGTSNTSPKNPYTTDGMPAKRSMQGRRMRCPRLPARSVI